MPGISSRKSSLDDIGSRDATPGSEAWAKWFVNQARITAKDLAGDVKSLQKLISKLEQYEAWKVLGYASFGMLCTKEIKIDADNLAAIRTAKSTAKIGDVISRAKGTKALREHGRPTKEESNKGSVTTLKKRGSDYLTARIARDRPDVLEQMKAGQFNSVRAAAIKAGIVKVKTPYENLQHWWNKSDKATRARFKLWIEET